jgi:hypothetical protein
LIAKTTFQFPLFLLFRGHVEGSVVGSGQWRGNMYNMNEFRIIRHVQGMIQSCATKPGKIPWHNNDSLIQFGNHQKLPISQTLKKWNSRQKLRQNQIPKLNNNLYGINHKKEKKNSLEGMEDKTFPSRERQEKRR